MAWDLRTDAPPPAANGGRSGGAPTDQPGGFFGRGRVGPLVLAGRYKATIGTVTGEAFAQVGSAQSFVVVPLPR